MNHDSIFKETIRDRLNRDKMVDQLIRDGFLKNPAVIQAFRRVPRHGFVDAAFQSRAYSDTHLPIGCDQTISKPSTVARMTELLMVCPDHRVLEIGTGCGYQTAILAGMCRKVYSVEWHSQLVNAARKMMTQLEYPTVRIDQGDGSQGWPSAAPFDRIIFTAGAPTIPEPVCYQLVDGGILIVPVGPRRQQELVRIIRSDAENDVIFDVSYHGSCEFVDLVGKNGWMSTT
ncbi:protein-L-isoaspartate(D-aspartate) O-methyltransferase [bacterium]|nr:protein-L-isoaspartate(D-aspartate) O-methyltransferase [candidate division CSSED10-310 bacterium]